MSKICHANRNNQCRMLNVGKCTGKSCPFKKTSTELKESVKKAYARISSLDEVVQKHISDTYYKGRYPWRKDAMFI